MSNTFKYCIYDYCITSYKYVEFISWPHCAPYIYIYPGYIQYNIPWCVVRLCSSHKSCQNKKLQYSAVISGPKSHGCRFFFHAERAI